MNEWLLLWACGFGLPVLLIVAVIWSALPDEMAGRFGQAWFRWHRAMVVCTVLLFALNLLLWLAFVTWRDDELERRLAGAEARATASVQRFLAENDERVNVTYRLLDVSKKRLDYLIRNFPFPWLSCDEMKLREVIENFHCRTATP